MALTVLQHEALLALLAQVPALVDSLEGRRSDYPSEVLEWVRAAETALQNVRSPAVAQVATCRARLIEAGRGVHPGDVVVLGRPSVRKVQHASATRALDDAAAVVQALVVDRAPALEEAQRMAAHLVVVARLKGWPTDTAPGRGHHEVLRDVLTRAAADPDLGSVQAHLLTLVGPTDALILLDRAR